MVVLGRVRFLMGEVPLYRAGDYAADWREDRLLLRRDWHGRHYRGGMRPTLVDVRCLPVFRCSPATFTRYPLLPNLTEDQSLR